MEDPRVQIKQSQRNGGQGASLTFRIPRAASQEDRTAGGPQYRGRSRKSGLAQED